MQVKNLSTFSQLKLVTYLIEVLTLSNVFAGAKVSTFIAGTQVKFCYFMYKL